MIYSADLKPPLRIPGWHNPYEARLIGIRLKPDTWLDTTLYERQDCDTFDIVLPTIFTGFYHECKNPGISGATEPVWATTKHGLTIDGATGLVWEAKLYNLMPISESISTVDIVATNGVTISAITNDTGSLKFMIDAMLPVPVTIPVTPPPVAIALGVFDVLITVTKSNTEQDFYSLRFRVAA
jgi:Ni,Fe-hydrogenase III small subunit